MTLNVSRVKTVPINYTLAKIKGAMALLNGTPISVKAFTTKNFLRRFQELVQTFKPDLIFTDSSAMAFYPLQENVPFVSDFMDVDSEKWRQFGAYSRGPMRFLYNLEARRLSDFETGVTETALVTFVVSEKEKERLNALAPNAQIEVIRNGVDFDYFCPKEGQAIPGRILFTGVMDYLPNADAVNWFCREVWPQVRRELPHATFFIVGRNPSPKVRRLGQLAGVKVTGAVEDIRPFFNQAEVCVAPLRFSIGLQNKVLEALAMGKPVVATQGAIQGLAPEVREVVKVADSSCEFVETLIKLLSDAEERVKRGKAGREFVQRSHDWDRNLRRLNMLMQETSLHLEDGEPKTSRMDE
jgi:sugar transferase (PEP-CTERM/EpsH1 system associated)